MRRTYGDERRRAGHYSHAVRAGDLLFVSGQAPVGPDGAVPIAFHDQARLCLRNVEAVLRAAGAGPEDIVKTTVWLHDWSDYGALNEVYAESFPTAPPARSTVQGARPPGQRLAIEAVAFAPIG